MIRSPKSVAIGLLSIATFTFAGSPVLAQMMATPADSAFLMKASQANMAEVAAGKMAQQMGSSMSVRELGAKLSTDHAMNEQKLMALAKTMHVSLPMQPAPADKMMAMKLKGMSGSSFDSAYIASEAADHKKNIATFKSEAGMTKNAKVAAYAKATLPALEMHLSMLQTDMSKMHTSNMNSGGSMGSGAMGGSTGSGGSMGSGSMGSGSMGSGSMGSGAAGSQNSGKSSSSGGQDGTPASNGAGGTGSRTMSSPMPRATGNMNPTSGGQIGTPASSGAGGSGNTNTGPNTSGSGSGSGSTSGSGSMNNPAPNNGTGGAPNPTASPNVAPGQKTN